MGEISNDPHMLDLDILRSIFDQSPEGVQVINKNWEYVYVNRTVAKQGQSTIEELTGHTMMEKYPGIDATPLFIQLKRCMTEKVSIRMENEFMFPGGTSGWFQLFIHPWVEGIMIFSIDITYRKLAEQRILEMIKHCSGAASTESDRKNVDELKRAVENLGKPSITVIG